MHPSRRMKFVLALGLAATSVVIPPSSRLLAQAVSATLQGTVTDAAGAAVPKATVTVRDTATGAVRKLVADEQGRYLAPNLQPGPYEIVVEAPTFSRKVFSGITLNVGDSKTIDTPLSAGSVSESVDVVATESAIQLSTSSNSTLIDNKQVVELPLSNRQFYSLALLSPAAFQPAQNSTLGFRGGINIAGASEISNAFSYNGVYNNDIGVAQPSYRPSVETIQEFRLLTGVYSAEYGRMSGGQVVIISKSGTNGIHGSAYEFNRNEWSDAKPYFTAAGVKKPRFRQNTFGGTIGGPIWKDKAFFFLGYEEQLIDQAFTAQATVPTSGLFAGETNMFNGVFNLSKVLYDPNTGNALTPVAGTTTTYDLKSIPTSSAINFFSVGAVAGQTLAQFGFGPAPAARATAAGAAPSNNYTFQEDRLESMHEGTSKIDYKINDKDSITGSFNVFEDPSFEPNNSLCSSYVLPNFGCMVNQISTILYVSYDRIIKPNIFNNFRPGFQRLQQPRIQQDNYSIGAKYPGLPGGPYFTNPNYPNNLGLPNTGTGGEFSNIGGPTNLPQNRFDNHYQIADTLTWIHGAHSFKFGVDALLAKTVNKSNGSTRGAFTVNDASIQALNAGHVHLGSSGDSFADLLLGLTYSSTIGVTAYNSYQNFNSQDFFVLDDWKLLPNLTLNLGLRYEIDSPIYSPNNQISNFNIATQVWDVADGNSQFSNVANTTGNGKYLYNYDLNNFAPRIGFSYQPFKNDKTVVKGAFGVFYNTPLIYNQFLGLSNGTPFKVNPSPVSVGSTPANGSTAPIINTIQLNHPFSVPATASAALPYCYKGTDTGCTANFSPTSVDRNYRTPYITEWSLGVQQQLSKQIVFESTYFGSKGTKLPNSLPLNVVNPATYTSTTAAPSQASRPYPNFQSVSRITTAGNSEFNSWQNSLKQTYANGLTFIVAYTYSHSLDGNGGIGSASNSSGSPQNVYNLRADRGTSDFNVKHRLVISPVYELPFGKGKAFANSGLASTLAGGFQLSGIFQFQTGRPFTVTDASTNNSGYFESADRPNVLINPNQNAPHTVAAWFNPGAFALANKFVVAGGVVTQRGAFGNEARNTVIGPQFTKLDLTLARKFHIYERVSGQFRAEGFNVLNHPNFLNPIGSAEQVGGSGYNTITQANDSRDLQFSLRILF